MPRIKQNAAKYAAEDFVKNIRKAGIDKGYDKFCQLAEAAGINEKTFRGKLKNPGAFKLSEILMLSSRLGLTLEDFAPLVGGNK